MRNVYAELQSGDASGAANCTRTIYWAFSSDRQLLFNLFTIENVFIRAPSRVVYSI